jgi:2-keto-4-pentenoate hydratase/2-oxohepta-3-ene-1,7-dioic acid hydratase in catechol pathway
MIHCLILSLAIAASLCVCAASPGAELKQPLQFARFVGANGKAVYGLVEGTNIREITGEPFGTWKTTERLVPLSAVKLLSVTHARTVFAMAGNYQDHLAGLPVAKLEKFKIPQFFLKAPACLCGHGDNIVYPKDAGRLDYEGELVVVIGKAGRAIPRERALDHVFGVTAGNDVSARDWQQNDVQWWRAKGSDTFGPCGPYISTGLDYNNLNLQVRVNGTVKMKSNTRLMVHNIPTAVSYLSQHVTLQPGDLIYTGTAGITEPIKVGDVVEVELEGVGVLRNKVVAPK